MNRIHAHSPAEHLAQVDDLLQEVFGFSFAGWRAGGWWTDDYHGCGIFEQGQLCAFAGVYRMDLLINSQLMPAIQIGSVATRSTCRGRGLSRLILEHILACYPNTPAFLCANQSVLDFYPRFGFRPVEVRQPVLALAEGNRSAGSPGPHKGGADTSGAPQTPAGLRRLALNDPSVETYLRERAVFSRIFDCANPAPINAFHLLHESSLCLYEVERLQAVLVVEHAGGCLHLVDVIARRPFAFAALAPALAFPGVHSVRFGFNPDWLGVDAVWQPPVEEPHLFVRGAWGVPAPFMLPYLLTT